jgi:hypothetical protein
MDGALAACAIYFSIAGFTAGDVSTAKAVLLAYWLVIGALFGLASAAFLRDSPSKLKLHYIAVLSLVPIVVLFLCARLAS